MSKSYILAIDQGTSSTKTIIFDADGQVVAKANEALHTSYLEGAQVEQDPEDIYQNVLTSVKKCLQAFEDKGLSRKEIACCGISNQRETFVVWDKDGRPLYNAVVWQCKRSIDVCKELKERGLEEEIKSKTGLLIDPYFSGSKLIWLNKHVPNVQAAIASGEAMFGTIDSWLLFKLTAGAQYRTDYTNASRTLFFNLAELSWDRELLEAFGLNTIRLPELKPSASNFGASTFDGLFDDPLPITAMIGDSHAATFGEGCFDPGTAKATLGTGCSVMMNIGDKPTSSQSGMVTTVCWSTAERIDYAMEGVIVSCGSVVEWFRNQLGLFAESTETEKMATSVEDNNGVYIVPAFSGLGAPYWDMSRKASIEGLTFDCNRNHLVRAALETVAYQIMDIVTVMETETGIPMEKLMLNGGMTSNKFVLNFLASLLNTNLLVGTMPDVSALGAAYLAGLSGGVYQSIDELKELHARKSTTQADKSIADVQKFYQEWKTFMEVKV
ncbi:glycerol kinase GlpK [Pedobacter sp. SYSU D00535]|uniref:FGGY family carbohydrate kinase n=1 Tax=Pedobacter sp. SYSU D00535 TaxID=2810308 RepID=UPI001A975445|nr:glycerol kinase GlpK [Pedobacter sp. SYSU D00535]